MLVALACGLPPFAESLECEDATGPRSLFGPGAKMPRPLGTWAATTACSAVAANPAYARAMILWKGALPHVPADLPCPLARSAFDGPAPLAPFTEAAPHAGEAAYAGPGGQAVPYAGEAPRILPDLSVSSVTFLAGKCTSTFDVAWKLREDRLLPPWGAVLAASQRGGRGQLRRAWHSPPGNLHVTFRLPADPLLQSDQASVVTGYLVAAAMRRLGFTLSLKWPNDLLDADGKKVGGILLEERNGTLLAGLGLNLAEAPSPAALRAEAAVPAAALSGGGNGAPLIPFSLWRALVGGLILEYTKSVAGKAPEEVLAAAEEPLAWKGRSVTLHESDGGTVSGVLHGLGPNGGVVLRRCGQGRAEAREYFSGSISL